MNRLDEIREYVLSNGIIGLPEQMGGRMESEDEMFVILKALTARAEKAERERDAAIKDLEGLLGQEEFIGVCWACEKDCKKGDACQPKWRGVQGGNE